MVAETQIITNRQFFIGEEATDEPIQLSAERFTLQAEFLRKGVELTISIIAWRAVQNVDFTIIGIGRLTGTILAVRRNRCQSCAAEIIIDLAGETIILGFAAENAVGADRDVTAIALVKRSQWLAKVTQYVDDVVGCRC